MKQFIKRCLILLLFLSFPLFGKDEVLHLLIWKGHAPKKFVTDFENKIERKYKRKVKLSIQYLTGPESFFDPIRAKKVDLVMMSHHFFKDGRFGFIEKKLLLPLNLKNIPNFKNIIPRLQNAKQLNHQGEIYGSPVSQGSYGLAYNTTLLKEPPKSWNILWDPKYKKKYVIGGNEYIYNATITALALGYSGQSISNFKKLNNEKFKKKFRELAQNAHSFWYGVDTADSLSGKILATSWGDSMLPLQKRGEVWKIAEPTEKSPWWIDNYAITWSLQDNPFLKKVAEEYINEILSLDYQIGHIMRTMSLTPIISNIGPFLSKEEKRQTKVNASSLFKDKRILQHTYKLRDRNWIKLMWENAMKGLEKR